MKPFKELYSRKYNFKFYHITKNAMTSMIRTCVTTEGLDDWVDIEMIPKNALTVAVIRNPIKRLISGIAHLHNARFSPIDHGEYKRHANFIIDKIIENKTRLNTWAEHEGFFNDHVSSQDYFLNMRDTRSEKDFFLTRNVKDVDIFLDHSNLTEDIKSKVDSDIHLSHLNKTARPDGYSKYNEVVNERRKEVYDLYKEDFELYEKIRSI